MSENLWVVQEPKQIEQVPVGSYTADYQGVEEVTLKEGGKRWRWSWKIKTGPLAGKLATALTDQSISPTKLAGVLIAGLLGRALQSGESVKAAIDACIGKTYLVSVQPGPKGGKPCVRMVAQLPPM
jgi:hypothetical protein